jgi:glycosyltransferase involved in cell wall biosynthesis/ubiquinone/menaquinone biosynthesis C-methylase UbiE
MTTVSFVMPVRNEEEYIRASLQSLVDQSYPPNECEVIVVDGRSSDRTREIIEEMHERNPHIRCLDNPAGIVPTAMNIGIRAARGEVIIRADGHNVYPQDYAANCVKYLAETGADNVGGPWVTVAANKSFSARLVAAVLSNPFGVGNSKFRTSREEGFVDTVPFGAFRREIFDRVGMYNEKLVRNQDNELNARIRKGGGRIYLTPALTTYYHPVNGFLKLLKYAFKTSQWNIFTLRENKESMGVRHLAPAIFLMFLLLLLPASFANSAARALFVGIACAYVLSGFYFSLRAKTEGNWKVALALPFATFCFHVAYGAGTLFGFRYLFSQPSARPIRPGLPVQEKTKQCCAGGIPDPPSDEITRHILKAKPNLHMLAPVPAKQSDSCDHEMARIRDAYARRQKGLPGRYSFFSPPHVLAVQERDGELLSMLSRHGVESLEGKRILEIGCGTSYLLRAFLQWGAIPENVFGIDLLRERIEQARKLSPHGVRLECGNAAALDFRDASFDLVVQSVVFSSILDREIRRQIAREMLRVLKPGGLAIWYDFFIDNPQNSDVQGIRAGEVHNLFPSCQISLRRITLAPPIGRLVGRYSPLVYMLLSRSKILCTHYLGVITKTKVTV